MGVGDTRSQTCTKSYKQVRSAEQEKRSSQANIHPNSFHGRHFRNSRDLGNEFRFPRRTGQALALCSQGGLDLFCPCFYPGCHARPFLPPALLPSLSLLFFLLFFFEMGCLCAYLAQTGLKCNPPASAFCAQDYRCVPLLLEEFGLKNR